MSGEQNQNGEVEKLKIEAQEYLNGWKRAKADLVNYQKQVDRERAEWLAYANSGCAKAILPVVDSLEAAVAAVLSSTLSESLPPGGGEKSVSPPLRGGIRGGADEGLQKICDQMLEALKQIGVETIKVAKEPPNPELHEVVGTEEISGGLVSGAPETKSPRIAPGLIVKEVQRGYTLHGKVLRPAKVIVAE